MTEFSHMRELFLEKTLKEFMKEELHVSVSHYEILSNQKVFFLISVWVWSGMWSSCCLSSDLWKCQWWQLACCVVTAFSSITVSPSTRITTLPGFLGQMPCLLKVTRCTLCHLPYPLKLGVAPFYASSFLTSLKCNEYRLWFGLVS